MWNDFGERWRNIQAVSDENRTEIFVRVEVVNAEPIDFENGFIAGHFERYCFFFVGADWVDAESRKVVRWFGERMWVRGSSGTDVCLWLLKFHHCQYST
jgi:hypothetical protein